MWSRRFQGQLRGIALYRSLISLSSDCEPPQQKTLVLIKLSTTLQEASQLLRPAVYIYIFPLSLQL